MPIGDRTDDALRMSGKNAPAMTPFGTREDIDDLLDYALREGTRVVRAVAEESKKAQKDAMSQVEVFFKKTKAGVGDISENLTKSSEDLATAIKTSSDLLGEVEALKRGASAKPKAASKDANSGSFRTEKKTVSVAEAEEYLEEMTSFSKGIKKEIDKMSGGFFSAFGDLKEASKALEEAKANGTEVDSSKIELGANAAQTIGNIIGNIVGNAVKAVAAKFTEYAETYETYLSSTATAASTDRDGYQKMNDQIDNAIDDAKLWGATTTKDALDDLDKLVGMGIQDNATTLAAYESIADRISTTWDVSTIADQMRVHGSDSGIYEYTLGAEAMMRETLKDQFGDTQYIQSGMYKTTRAALQTLFQMQETAEESAELEYAIQSGVAAIYEAGASVTATNTLVEGIKDITTKGYTDNTAVMMAVQEAGLNLADANKWGPAEMEALTKGYASVMDKFQQDNLAAAGAIAEEMGWETQDAMQGGGSNFLDSVEEMYGENGEGPVSAKDLIDKFNEEAQNTDSRVTFQRNVENYLDQIVANMGADNIANLGSGFVSGIGGIVSTVASIAVGKLATKGIAKMFPSLASKGGLGKLFGKGASTAASGGSTAAKVGIGSKIGTALFGQGGFAGFKDTLALAKMGAGAGTSTNAIGGLAGKFLTTANGGGMGAIKGVGFTTATKVAGGVGAGIAMVADGASAVKNATYFDNDKKGGKFGNAVAGALMGNASGKQTVGGYAKAIGSNALKGAAVGAMFGPVGAAIGAGVGGLLGGLGNFFAGKKKKKAEKKAQEEASSSSKSEDKKNTNDYNSILNSINQSVNLQTDRIIAAMTNLYKLVDERLSNIKVVRAGDYY